MKRVIIKPKQQRAKNRVEEHGDIMLLVREEPDKFLVRSLDQEWFGWFTWDEADKETENCNGVQ